MKRKAIFNEFVRWLEKKNLKRSAAKRYALVVSKIHNKQPLTETDRQLEPYAVSWWRKFEKSRVNKKISKFEWEKVLDDKTVEVAKLIFDEIKDEKVNEKIIYSLLEKEEDPLKTFILGCFVGAIGGEVGVTLPADMIFHSLSLLKEGKTVEEIKKELELLRKEYRLDDFMAYGG